MSSDKKNICIIGLGYVGLPLAVAFAKKFKVVGFDIDKSRVKDLKDGNDKTLEVKRVFLDSVKSNITYTSNIKDTKKCNIYIVTVPTPIDKANRPNLDPLIKASLMIGSILKKDDIVIYESTVYPGVTRDVCVPVLAKTLLSFKITSSTSIICKETISFSIFAKCAPSKAVKLVFKEIISKCVAKATAHLPPFPQKVWLPSALK